MSRKDTIKTFYAISFAWQLGFLIVFAILGFLLLGRFIDSLVGTTPLFSIIGFFVGFSVTLYEVYHMLTPILKNDDKS